jgi:hypothetical protein
MQAIVLGMHRSGTSMVTRLINLMGAYVGAEGTLLGPDPSNPKGYWERRDVITLNDALLLLSGCTWKRVAGWCAAPSRPIAPELRDAMQNVILGMDAFRPWVMKDPRLCLTLPHWMPHLEVPVAVLVYREPREIVRSLGQRDQMSDEFGLALWEYHAVGALNATREMPRIFARHDRLIMNPVETVSQLVDQLGAAGVHGLRRPSAREVGAFVDPALSRAGATGPELQLPLNVEQRAVAAMLRDEVQQDRALEVSRQSQDVMTRMRGEQLTAAILKAGQMVVR